MKRILAIILMLCALVNTITAQRITHNFNNASMSDALKYIQQQTSKHKIIFIYNELEDFLLDNALPSYFLGVCQDFKHFAFCVSVIILNSEGTRIR